MDHTKFFMNITRNSGLSLYIKWQCTWEMWQMLESCISYIQKANDSSINTIPSKSLFYLDQNTIHSSNIENGQQILFSFLASDMHGCIRLLEMSKYICHNYSKQVKLFAAKTKKQQIYIYLLKQQVILEVYLIFVPI